MTCICLILCLRLLGLHRTQEWIRRNDSSFKFSWNTSLRQLIEDENGNVLRTAVSYSVIVHQRNKCLAGLDNGSSQSKLECCRFPQNALHRSEITLGCLIFHICTAFFPNDHEASQNALYVTLDKLIVAIILIGGGSCCSTEMQHFIP